VADEAASKFTDDTSAITAALLEETACSADEVARPKSVRRGNAGIGAFITDVVRVLFRTGRDGGARDLECGIIARSAPTSTLPDMSDGRAVACDTS